MPARWRQGQCPVIALTFLSIAALCPSPASAQDSPKSLRLPTQQPASPPPALSTPLSTPLLPTLDGARPIGPQAAPSQPSSTAAPGAVGQLAIAEPDPAVRAAYDTAFDESIDKPSDPEVLAKFAELAIQVGDVEGAISALERLLLIDSDQPDVKLELGVLYFRLGSTEAAKMYLTAARSSPEASNETKERASTFLQEASARK
jgi:hypothetical protein